MANHCSILALKNPMNSMKRQKDRTLKDELPRSVGAQYVTGDQWRNMACVILPENIDMEAESLDKATSEGMVVLQSPLSAYDICGRMAAKGIPANS